jgi:hypothetical protein
VIKQEFQICGEIDIFYLKMIIEETEIFNLHWNLESIRVKTCLPRIQSDLDFPLLARSRYPNHFFKKIIKYKNDIFYLICKAIAKNSS